MERVLGNIFTRTMYFEKAGQVVRGHKHNFDHVTLVLCGAVSVRFSKEVGGVTVFQKVEEFYAPKQMYGDKGQEAQILIEADVHHEITALEDNTHCWCVFSHRDPDTGEVVDKWNGNKAATN
jgi:quercetin dioxygenase-like cupin family protein